jgi:hypothetical protein
MFEKDAREFALDLVDQGMIDPMMLLTAALNWMSQDEVRDMLDANELSPRFEEDEEDDGQPDEAQEWESFDPEC